MPTGQRQLCFSQKALTVGKQPGDHKTNMRYRLSQEVAVHIKDVYVRLSDRDLLSRCLRSVTQNRNEFLHAKVWAKCPKTGIVGLQRVLLVTCLAVAEYNSGVKEMTEQLYGAMGMTPGPHLTASGEKADQRRLRQSLRQTESRTKEARRARRLYVRQAAGSSALDYASGAF